MEIVPRAAAVAAGWPMLAEPADTPIFTMEECGRANTRAIITDFLHDQHGASCAISETTIRASLLPVVQRLQRMNPALGDGAAVAHLYDAFRFEWSVKCSSLQVFLSKKRTEAGLAKRRVGRPRGTTMGKVAKPIIIMSTPVGANAFGQAAMMKVVEGIQCLLAHIEEEGPLARHQWRAVLDDDNLTVSTQIIVHRLTQWAAGVVALPAPYTRADAQSWALKLHVVLSHPHHPHHHATAESPKAQKEAVARAPYAYIALF